MADDYGQLPPGVKLPVTPFKSAIPDSALSTLKQLVEISPIAPDTYENLRTDGQYGITRQWLIDSQKYWATEWNWRDVESRFNSNPNFTAPIKARDGETYTVHFTALFSTRKDAEPIVCLHGWPGSVFEFLPYLSVVREKWPSPDELPWHVVVPSLIGYGFSSGPGTKTLWTTEDIAYVMNELMVGLGFSSYIAHGGDIGSFISRILVVRYDACRAVNLNFFAFSRYTGGIDPKEVSETEAKNLQRFEQFATYGDSYAKEHGTKGGTIGLVLSSSPLALLGWIGEKFIAWSDETPALKDIVDSVALYWLTETFPRCIYPYVDFTGRGEKSTTFHGHPDFYCKKPMGYSYFPMDLAPMPVAWVKTTGNLIWHRSHDSGGHFAAMEKPKELVQDMEDFLKALEGVDAGDGGLHQSAQRLSLENES